jgi:hypothetical protein
MLVLMTGVLKKTGCDGEKRKSGDQIQTASLGMYHWDVEIVFDQLIGCCRVENWSAIFLVYAVAVLLNGL